MRWVMRRPVERDCRSGRVVVVVVVVKEGMSRKKSQIKLQERMQHLTCSENKKEHIRAKSEGWVRQEVNDRTSHSSDCYVRLPHATTPAATL